MSTEIETDRLVRTFIKIRNRRSALAKAYDEEDSGLKDKLKLVEVELLRRALEGGLTGFKTADGTTYISEDKHVSIEDTDKFTQFVLEEGDLSFFERRPALGHIIEYQEAHDGALPPGIKMFRENRMRVRASKK